MGSGIRNDSEQEAIQERFRGKTISKVETYDNSVVEFFFTDGTCVQLATSCMGESAPDRPAKISMEEI